ncbi:MAG: hypothetical protein AB7W28_10195 [Armatimonadota bacterium]
MAPADAEAVVQYAGLTEPEWELLDVLVERAEAAVEDYCGCRFEPRDLDELYDVAENQQELRLRQYPVRSLTAVYDGVTGTWPGRLLEAVEYLLDAEAGLVRLRKGLFTAGRGSVRVVYRAGYEQVPAAVTQAVVMLAAEWYRNRPDGRATAERYDGYSANYAVEAIPPRVAELLARYRRRGLA